jgi:hypothetical protein
MKKIIFLAFALIGLSSIDAQAVQQVAESKALPAETIDFAVVEHDFGKIPQGKPVFFNFTFRNSGGMPMKLDNVQASCGCTTPEWNKEPVAAGGSDKIRVGYNAAAEGYFEKMITITYNENQTKQIKIKGTVWKAPATSAPSNASVQFLKQQIQ